MGKNKLIFLKEIIIAKEIKTKRSSLFIPSPHFYPLICPKSFK